MHTVTHRLTSLRELMRKHNIDAYLILSGDSHKTKYTPGYWRTREWISGFTGSAGTVVVTANDAGLWTDGRYTIQAEIELKDSGIQLHQQVPGAISYTQYIANVMPHGGKLGFDGRTLSVSDLEAINQALDGNTVTYYTQDIINEIWRDRPPLTTQPAFEHKLHFAGKTAAEKLQDVRASMKEKGYTAYLVTALDDIAWLLNIRGADVPYIPVVYAYALITEDSAHVFINPSQTLAVAHKLTAQGFTLHAYTALPTYLHSFTTHKLYYNSTNTNIQISQAIPQSISIENKNDMDIIPSLKAIKTATELANIKDAYISEGIAMVKTLAWLSKVFIQEKQPVSESDIAQVLKDFRSMQPHYLCDSFHTIAAYGANASQVHYKTNGDSLQHEGLLLIDTGGQYLNGTTDTSRTIALGQLTNDMKRDYTLVLKGHIALCRAKFPRGTSGSVLDAIVRQYLWEAGENFAHSTGHGIGYCLSVHEGPQHIAYWHASENLSPGMLISNEPGIYKKGRYGIRTESVLLVVDDCSNSETTFYSFENLTHCPIDTQAIDMTMLTTTEREWLNNYNHSVYMTLSPHLTGNEREWLTNATKPI